MDNLDLPVPDQITIFPPENAAGEITDEDSGEEDEVILNNLPGSQLRALVEVEGEIIDDYVENTDSDLNVETQWESEDELTVAAYVRKNVSNSNINRKSTYNWINRDIVQNVLPWKNQFGPVNQYTPLEAFSLFFDKEVFEMLTHYTNIYASLKNKTGDISESEMKCFIGVLLVSGYTIHPRRYMYWENSGDTNNSVVCDAISRNRFTFIMENLHCCDNRNLTVNDKFTKIRPLFNALNKKFLEFAPLEEVHSIDESMIPYFGRHGSKQFIKGKPIRWGYKFWTGTTKYGYIEWFEPYQGSTTNVSEKFKSFGLGPSVILEFAHRLQEKHADANFHLYFDNFFTTLKLLEELRLLGFKATGTIRENRLGKECPVSHSSMLKKKSRGTFEYVTSEDNSIMLCKWHDNNVVTVASNYNKVYPLNEVKRFSQKEKKYIFVAQPNLVKYYNENMGGVDRADQNISLYRTSIRGKKWYFPLICHCLDMCVQNAWHLYRQGGGKKDHLRFRQALALALLETNKKSNKRGPSRPSRNLHEHSRYDRIDHLIMYQDKQTRCFVCHKKCNFLCSKCNLTLHPKICFYSYHTQ